MLFIRHFVHEPSLEKPAAFYSRKELESLYFKEGKINGKRRSAGNQNVREH